MRLRLLGQVQAAQRVRGGSRYHRLSDGARVTSRPANNERFKNKNKKKTEGGGGEGQTCDSDSHSQGEGFPEGKQNSFFFCVAVKR